MSSEWSRSRSKYLRPGDFDVDSDFGESGKLEENSKSVSFECHRSKGRTHIWARECMKVVGRSFSIEIEKHQRRRQAEHE